MSIVGRIKKHKKKFYIFFGLLFVVFFIVFILSFGRFDKVSKKTVWGVTFAKPYTESLGLDWRET